MFGARLLIDVTQQWCHIYKENARSKYKLASYVCIISLYHFFLQQETKLENRPPLHFTYSVSISYIFLYKKYLALCFVFSNLPAVVCVWSTWTDTKWERGLLKIDLQSHTAVPAVEIQRLTGMEVICSTVHVAAVSWRRSSMCQLRVNVRNVLLFLDQSFNLNHVLFEISEEVNFTTYTVANQ